jgi:DNA-binding CsgD family transcriptional regulator
MLNSQLLNSKFEKRGSQIHLVKANAKNEHLASLHDLFKLPVNAFFLDKDSSIIAANNQTVLTNASGPRDTVSSKDVIGKSLLNLIEKRAAGKILQNDSIVNRTGRSHIFEEVVLHLDDFSFTAISFKFPCYNQYNQQVAILGLSVLLSDAQPLISDYSSFTTGFEAIQNLGFLSSDTTKRTLLDYLPGKHICGAYLTQQETRCLHFLLRGYTIKMIAKNMELSPRTIETHCENIKSKYNIATKSELIAKIFDSLWGPV